jgi:charged multivesicular body protein 5
LDALGDELDFEEEEIPSYLQEDPVDLPKAAETDPKLVINIFVIKKKGVGVI